MEGENIKNQLSKMDGIIVAPGFGSRAVEGKISAVKFARENQVPFLGICLGPCHETECLVENCIQGN